MSDFVPVFAESDAAALEREATELLEAQLEGWKPAEGNLEVWLTKAFARIASTVFDLASEMSAAAFKRFGEAVVNVPPIQATSATVSSTWTMVDSAGYTIPAGTQVSIAASGEATVGFEVTESVTVEAGKTTATVELRAIEPGTAANGLTASPKLIDALAFVSSIVLVGSTSGGVDEEEEDAYLNRLVEDLQLLSRSLIVSRDFEIDARSVAGIARAKCIDNYNPETETTGNPLMVCVFPVDVNGEPLSSGVKTELQARQAAKVPAGVVVHVADPKYTSIDVTVAGLIAPGFNEAEVLAAVKAALTSFLEPKNWGLPEIGDTSTQSGWENETKVYRFDLVAVCDRVPGFKATTLELAEHGKALGTADITLAGTVPLTRPGTITVT